MDDPYSRKDVNELRQELAEREAGFKLRWEADMRAIKRWHEAGGDELTWPDHADLVVWLLEQLQAAEQRIEVLEMRMPRWRKVAHHDPGWWDGPTVLGGETVRATSGDGKTYELTLPPTPVQQDRSGNLRR